MTSKYYIRISNDDAPPKYINRMSGDRPIMTDRSSVAKRYDNIELAEMIAEKLRAQTSQADGESCLIEVIDSLTDKPVGAPEDDPEAVAPPPAAPFPEWAERGYICNLRIFVKKTAGEFIYRYTDPAGNSIEGTDAAAIITAFCKDAAAEMIRKVKEYERKRNKM